MTKSELIEKIKARLAADTNTKHIYERTVIAAVLDALGAVAGEDLASGSGEVPLPGLGKLERRSRKARKGRNPQTGAEIDIPAGRTVVFGAGKALKDALKGATA